jgi:hypothetical protein
MRTNDTNEKSEDNREQVKRVSGAQDLATTTVSNPLSRRSFFGRVTAATGVGLPAFLLSENAKAVDDDDQGADADDGSRRARSYRIRHRAAIEERKIPTPRQISNGDEARYPNFIGNYSQGLPHNSIGEVDPTAYQALLTAVDSGNPSDFANIPLGGNTKLTNPQGGLAFDLEGTDSGQLTNPPSPKLASAERAGEMVEDYWMALARDIPFSQYGAEPVTAAAIVDLNRLSHLPSVRSTSSIYWAKSVIGRSRLVFIKNGSCIVPCGLLPMEGLSTTPSRAWQATPFIVRC